MPSHPDRVRKHYEFQPQWGARLPICQCPTCGECFMEMSRIDAPINVGRFKACCQEAARNGTMK